MCVRTQQTSPSTPAYFQCFEAQAQFCISADSFELLFAMGAGASAAVPGEVKDVAEDDVKKSWRLPFSHHTFSLPLPDAPKDPPRLEAIVAAGLWPTSRNICSGLLDNLEVSFQDIGPTGTS